MNSKKFNTIHLIENYSNSYIVELDDKLILIDAGFDKKAKKIIETLSSFKKKLSHIILTHSHLDHINGLAKVKENFPEAKVVCHKNAEEYVKGKKLLLPKGIKKFFYSLFSPFIKGKGVTPNILVKGGEKIEGLKIVETLGHTNDSICIIYKNNLFMGDLVINEKEKLSFPPKEFNYDEKLMINSIRKILKEKFENMFFGHGKPIIGNGKLALKNFLSLIK